MTCFPVIHSDQVDQEEFDEEGGGGGGGGGGGDEEAKITKTSTSNGHSNHIISDNKGESAEVLNGVSSSPSSPSNSTETTWWSRLKNCLAGKYLLRWYHQSTLAGSQFARGLLESIRLHVDCSLRASSGVHCLLLTSTSSMAILCSPLSLCCLLTAVFILAQHLLTFIPAVVNCSQVPVEVEESGEDKKKVLSPLDVCTGQLLHYYHLAPLIMLLLISASLSHYKLLLRGAISGLYLAVLAWMHFSGASWEALSPQISSTSSSTSASSSSIPLVSSFSLLFAAFFALLLLVRDRHQELISRRHQLWRAKLKVEQEDVETYGGINKILLENILPQHVAQHFLLNISNNTGTLYHER